MKKLVLFLLTSVSLFFSFHIEGTSASFNYTIYDSGASIFEGGWGERTLYCNGWECLWIEEWIEEMYGQVNWVVRDKGASQYIQDVMIYIISFISIIAVIYMIYAWFVILTSAWDDEKIKKTKQIIIYVIVGIIIIWMAWSIYLFVVNILGGENGSNCDYCYSLPNWEQKNRCLSNYNCIDL